MNNRESQGYSAELLQLASLIKNSGFRGAFLIGQSSVGHIHAGLNPDEVEFVLEFIKSLKAIRTARPDLSIAEIRAIAREHAPNVAACLKSKLGEQTP